MNRHEMLIELEKPKSSTPLQGITTNNHPFQFFLLPFFCTLLVFCFIILSIAYILIHPCQTEFQIVVETNQSTVSFLGIDANNCLRLNTTFNISLVFSQDTNHPLVKSKQDEKNLHHIMINRCNQEIYFENWQIQCSEKIGFFRLCKTNQYNECLVWSESCNCFFYSELNQIQTLFAFHYS